MEKLDFPTKHQYTFRDALNDFEMLSTIENSVAMGNAAEKIKAVAKFESKSVKDNGISHGLKMVHLL
ncbi:hypothetical protein UP17_25365 (plasmid) [Peribacillus simplex]|nr:hypothetical protein UP17_25365 [Peribacillus simplex]